MSEKRFNTRVINKHETEANWQKSSLIPLQAEIIVYDIDENYNYERFKIGDGVQNVNALPFVCDALRSELVEQINTVDEKVDNVSALVGDTSVAKQIEDAIDGHTHDVIYLKTEINLPEVVEWASVVYGDKRFVAVAANSDKAAYSEDGISWKMAQLPKTETWSAVTYGGGYYVAVAKYSDTYVYSRDGETWYSDSMPSAQNWASIAYGNGIFVAIAPDNVCAYGTIGGTFSSSTLPLLATWTDVTFNGLRFIAVSEDNRSIALSYDGSYWESASYYNDFAGLTSVAAAPTGLSVASGITLSSAFQYSYDGYSWMETSVTYGNWSDLAYGNGIFVAIEHGSNRAMYSEDAVTWIDTVLPASEGWSDVIYGGGKFIVISDTNAALAYSYDGKTWSVQRPVLTDREGNDVTDQIANLFSEWVQIYDSGVTNYDVNAFANIDVSGYKHLMVAIRCANTTSSAGGISGAIVFEGDNGKDYSFTNILPNLIRNVSEVSGGMAMFKIMDGFIVCENAMRALSASHMLSDTDGLGADNMTPLGGGVIRCSSAISTMIVSNATLSNSYYYGAGSRVIVWGCRV